MNARRRGTLTVALLMLTASMLAFGTIPSAQATQGQAVIAGQGNGETSETVVVNNNVSYGFGQCGAFANFGLEGCGATGLVGDGTNRGVAAYGSTYGVYALGNVV